MKKLVGAGADQNLLDPYGKGCLDWMSSSSDLDYTPINPMITDHQLRQSARALGKELSDCHFFVKEDRPLKYDCFGRC